MKIHLLRYIVHVSGWDNALHVWCGFSTRHNATKTTYDVRFIDCDECLKKYQEALVAKDEELEKAAIEPS